jgi:hypothetical protein
MAKRFTATEIWGEDWFLEMPKDYKLFWYYMLAECDHAGLFKVNVRSFCALNEANLTPKEAIDYFNNGKDRIRVISSSLWLIEDFFVFQYGPTFNVKNRVHESISELYKKHNIEIFSIRGLIDLKDGDKDKDKDKDKDIVKHKGEKNGTNSFVNTQTQGQDLYAGRYADGLPKIDSHGKVYSK